LTAGQWIFKMHGINHLNYIGSVLEHHLEVAELLRASSGTLEQERAFRAMALWVTHSAADKLLSILLMTSYIADPNKVKNVVSTEEYTKLTGRNKQCKLLQLAKDHEEGHHEYMAKKQMPAKLRRAIDGFNSLNSDRPPTRPGKLSCPLPFRRSLLALHRLELVNQEQYHRLRALNHDRNHAIHEIGFSAEFKLSDRHLSPPTVLRVSSSLPYSHVTPIEGVPEILRDILQVARHALLEMGLEKSMEKIVVRLRQLKQYSYQDEMTELLLHYSQPDGATLEKVGVQLCELIDP
jgi:hypothetical protein